MTQEEKDLLLKDLCARLPYGVEIQIIEWATLDTTLKTGHIARLLNNDAALKQIKPYLFPLSSMTEEQKEDLYIVTNGKFNADYKYIDNCKPRNWSEWGTTEYNWIRHYDIDLLYTWLNKNHFDYRGLIEKGLAIDATGLNIYKEE